MIFLMVQDTWFADGERVDWFREMDKAEEEAERRVELLKHLPHHPYDYVVRIFEVEISTADMMAKALNDHMRLDDCPGVWMKRVRNGAILEGEE